MNLNQNLNVKEFKKELRDLNTQAYDVTKDLTKPAVMDSFMISSNRFAKSVKLIFLEPEIIFFSILQVLTIGTVYYLWVQILNWIPDDFAKSSETMVNIIFLIWSIICIGIAAFPVGFFTACIGVVHILHSQNRRSTIFECFKFVYPKILPIWVYSWVDAGITVRQIIRRLPKKDENVSVTRKMFEETMYYAWKIGTIGIIPSILTSHNIGDTSRNALGFLKEKTLEIIKLRLGYSAINWALALTMYLLMYIIPPFRIEDYVEVHSKMFRFYFIVGIPIIFSATIIQLFIRPFYILSLFEAYNNYLIETNQKVTAPLKSKYSFISTLFFIALILVLLILLHYQDFFIFHEIID